MNPRRTAKATLKSSWRLAHDQAKLVTNAQESKIFKSNVTTIKVNCSNNFPRPNSVEITYTNLEQSENFTIYTLKSSPKRENHSTNNAF